MQITYQQNLKSFRTVLALQRLVNDADPLDSTVIRLKSVCKGYVTELKYRLALFQPFSDEFDRLARAKEAMRSMNFVFDWIAETFDPGPRPPLVDGLLQFMGEASIDLALVVRFVEEQHPELKWLFDQERADYARIHEQWRKEDEAEHLD